VTGPSGGGGIRALSLIEVRQVALLFNFLYPSPFQDRDLDDEAKGFIVGCAQCLAPCIWATQLRFLQYR
jgi:hypothetical protein